MKLLSHQQSTILQGNLERLPLPKDTYLYVSPGIPQSFQLVSAEEDLTFDDSWVYIPQEELDSFRQQLLVHATDPGHSCLALNPVETEDGNLFPALINGQVRAVVVDRSRRHTTFDSEVLLMLREAFVAFDSAHQGRLEEPLIELVAGLIGSDMQVEDFYYHIFQNLTRHCERLLAAVYTVKDNVYHRGLVTGDITLYENLPREVPLENAQIWTDGIRRRRFFHPSELAPSHTCFLDSPLDFLFIHQGIASDNNEQLVVTAVPGDSDRRLAHLLTESARLTESLHERQFGVGVELESIQRDLRKQGGRDVFLRAATRIMQRLRRVLPFSRLALYDLRGDSAVVLTPSEAGDWTGAERPTDSLPDEIRQELTDRGIAMVDSVEASVFSEDYIQQCLDDNVLSEVFYPGITERSAVFGFGCSTAGMRLRANRRLLFRAAQVLDSALAVSRRLDASALSDGVVPDSIDDDRYRCSRLGTISRLANGYFHDIVDYLSVVMGQISLAESGTESRQAVNGSAVRQGLKKIREAMDSITDYLKRLRSLTTMEIKDFDKKTTFAEFVTDLHWMLHGFARQIRDTRNITLRLNPEMTSRGQTQMSLATIFDVLLPLIMSLMDEAVCSGTLTLRVHEREGREQLDIVFNPEILAHGSVAQFVQQVFPDAATGLSGNRLDFGEATLIHGQQSSTVAHLTLMGRSQQSAPDVARSAMTFARKGQNNG